MNILLIDTEGNLKIGKNRDILLIFLFILYKLLYNFFS